MADFEHKKCSVAKDVDVPDFLKWITAPSSR